MSATLRSPHGTHLARRSRCTHVDVLLGRHALPLVVLDLVRSPPRRCHVPASRAIATSRPWWPCVACSFRPPPSGHRLPPAPARGSTSRRGVEHAHRIPSLMGHARRCGFRLPPQRRTLLAARRTSRAASPCRMVDGKLWPRQAQPAAGDHCRLLALCQRACMGCAVVLPLVVLPLP